MQACLASSLLGIDSDFTFQQHASQPAGSDGWCLLSPTRRRQTRGRVVEKRQPMEFMMIRRRWNGGGAAAAAMHHQCRRARRPAHTLLPSGMVLGRRTISLSLPSRFELSSSSRRPAVHPLLQPASLKQRPRCSSTVAADALDDHGSEQEICMLVDP